MPCCKRFLSPRRLVRAIGAAFLAAGLSCGAAGVAKAHTLDKASLRLKQEAPGRFRWDFQTGSATLKRQLSRSVIFPAHCRDEGRVVDCGDRGLVGTLRFPWLEGSYIHLMVSIEWLDGSRMLRVVTARHPFLALYATAEKGVFGAIPVIVDYTLLGVEHILGGFDHLFFVLALAFLVGRRKTLLWTITSFTLAHSITLAASTLGWFSVPLLPVEALIALSIVLLCAECLRPSNSLTRRNPWAVAFAFGLMHGFGFASALREVGLPEKHLPLALFSFNLGVELGQLGVLLGTFLVSVALGRFSLRTRFARVLLYAMGSISAFWTIERVVSVLTS